MFVSGLASALMVSAVLCLIVPMLRVPTGWFRLTLAVASVLTLVQVVLIFTSNSAFLLSSPSVRDFALLNHADRFFDGIAFLVGILVETILRASIAFGISFGISDATLWVWRGFFPVEKTESC